MTFQNVKRIVVGLLIVAAVALGAVWLAALALSTSSVLAEADQNCRDRWGDKNVIWAGASDSELAPICSCAKGYIWQNSDGTVGTSFGTSGAYDFISAPGRCIEQQK